MVGRAARLHGEALLCLECALIPLLFVLSPSRPRTRSKQSREFLPCPIPAFLLPLLRGIRFLSMPHSAAYIPISIPISISKHPQVWIFTSTSTSSLSLDLIFKVFMFQLLTQFCSLCIENPAGKKAQIVSNQPQVPLLGPGSPSLAKPWWPWWPPPPARTVTLLSVPMHRSINRLGVWGRKGE